jgi:hypothetical protein
MLYDHQEWINLVRHDAFPASAKCNYSASAGAAFIPPVCGEIKKWADFD